LLDSLLQEIISMSGYHCSLLAMMILSASDCHGYETGSPRCDTPQHVGIPSQSSDVPYNFNLQLFRFYGKGSKSDWKLLVGGGTYQGILVIPETEGTLIPPENHRMVGTPECNAGTHTSMADKKGSTWEFSAATTDRPKLKIHIAKNFTHFWTNINV